MKTLFLVTPLVVALVASPFAVAKGTPHAKGGEVHVKAHVTKDGTYVPTHERTAPNATKLDNWSTKGNVNPNTGNAGTKDPYQH